MVHASFTALATSRLIGCLYSFNRSFAFELLTVPSRSNYLSFCVLNFFNDDRGRTTKNYGISVIPILIVICATDTHRARLNTSSSLSCSFV